MQYITPLVEDLNSIVFGGTTTNECSGPGQGQGNSCNPGIGNDGCWCFGGDGHNCDATGIS